MSDMVQLKVLPAGENEARAEISWGSTRFVIEETANVSLNKTHTPWLAPALAYAMEKNVPLRLAGPVDSTALNGSSAAQDLITSWWPEKFHKVEIVAEPTTDDAPDGRGIGCFFSGGVDSFHSTVSNLDEVTHLVWVHGFDIFLSNERYAETTLKALRAAAKDLGKELIEIRTNIRNFYEGYHNGWDLGHGVALAHTALLLSDHIHSILVPASHSVGHLAPYGSHPELDHNWSSTATQLIYDGFESNRVMKCEVIKDNEAAMRHLRVCFWNRNDIQNCGECEKCVRTVINFRIAGAVGRCTAMPDIDPIKSLERVIMDEVNGKFFVRENLDAMDKLGVDDPELRAALVKALNRGPLQKAKAMYYQSIIAAKVLAMTVRDKALKRI
ncbi:hypothetical protein [Tomitella biformata]|uniref:hypothetical protein n=1 Tax=Tomitella biformata TaxID=630403 RepID=UPI000463A8C9|nr:hypothetical protein [Tomitella biformata]